MRIPWPRAAAGWPHGAPEDVVRAVRDAAIGDDAVLDGPFGPQADRQGV